MHKKQRGKGRFRAVIVSGILCAVTLLGAGCDGNEPPAKAAPPVPHTFGDIALRGSEVSVMFTPTAVVSPDPTSILTPRADRGLPDGTETVPPLSLEKGKAETIVERAPKKMDGPPGGGDFTIQIGAYIVDENLARIREKIVSLGFSPYVKEMKQKMTMFCVIVGEGLGKDDADGTVSDLSDKGFNARSLPGKNGTVDVAAGIYYYRDDALAADGRVKALGYAPRIEERVVEVFLKRLRVGGYGTIGEAKKDLTVLEQKGFTPVILKSDQ
jgi:cell division protein FtsN